MCAMRGCGGILGSILMRSNSHRVKEIDCCIFAHLGSPAVSVALLLRVTNADRHLGRFVLHERPSL